MTKNSKTITASELHFRESFLAQLNVRLAQPTSEYPTTRYWTKSHLDKLFKEVRDQLSSEGIKSRITLTDLLNWLCKLNLAAPLPIEGKSIYGLEMDAGSQTEIDPLELLMAVKPQGVICFFSAIGYHSLTTQNVEHHHIAELQNSDREHQTSTPKAKPEQISDTIATESKRAPRGLGTLLFNIEGTPYYSTRRKAHLVPGVQTRWHGPRTQIRITTLEQTLLDTLIKPFECGGPEVVFDAWNEATSSKRIDEDRLLTYLSSMQYPATARRVGAMLDVIGVTLSEPVKQFLCSVQESIDAQSPFAQISLLPGLSYTNTNSTWLVKTP